MLYVWMLLKTKPLKSLGIDKVDAAVVSIGTNFEKYNFNIGSFASNGS